MAGTIFAVETKAGLIIRKSETKQYTHAVVVDGWAESWTSTYEQAKRATARFKGDVVIKPVSKLEKPPADPNPTRHVYGIEVPSVVSRTVQAAYLVTDDAGSKEYVKLRGAWVPADTVGIVRNKREIVEHNDKLRLLYSLDSYLEGVRHNG